MEFNLALKEVANQLPLDDEGFDLKFAQELKKKCQTNEDWLQLQEYKCIVDAHKGFIKDLFLAYQKSEKENNGFSHLASKIEEIAQNLEKHEISCYTYAYYISSVLELFYELYKNPSYKELQISKVRWLNPSEYNYQHKASLTGEESFGFGRLKVSYSDFIIARDVLKRDILKGIKSKTPYVIIPAGIKIIDKGAFKNNKYIKSVFIPDSVEKIGKEAFMGCTSLEMVTLPKRVLKLPDSCFEDCTKLKRINTQNIIQVDSRCFKNCIALNDNLVFYALSEVGSEAFANCKKIKESGFVSQITEIDARAFEGCGFTSISLERCKKLGREAFLNCKFIEKVELVTIPQAIQGEPFKGATNVKVLNLERNKSLEKPHTLFYKKLEDFNENMKLLETIKQDEINKNQFASYQNIKNVEIRSSDTVPSGAFCSCTNLISVTMRTPVKHIGKSAFSACVSLEKINMSYNGDTIPEDAFYKCSRLEYIESFLENVKSFGKRSLAYTDLTRFNFSRKFERLERFCFANAKFPTGNIRLDLTNAKVEEGAFHGIGDILTLKIDYSPNIYNVFDKTKESFSKRRINYLYTYGAIDKEAFAGYSNIRYIEFDVKDKELAPSAFDGCSSLASVKVKGQINKIGQFTFKDCTELNNLIADGEISELDTGALFACKNAESLIDISKIKRFGKYSVAKSDIKSLSLGENVEYIGQGAFYGCDSLSELCLPFVGTSKNATGEEVGLGAIFTENPSDNLNKPSIPSGIKEVTINSFELPKSAFSGCKEITIINLPKIIELVNPAFNGCDSLLEIQIGKSLSKFSPLSIKEIGDNTQVVISNECPNFTQEKGSIFSRNKKSLYFLSDKDTIERVISEISTIEEYAVENASEELIIPKNITKIASMAIDCKNTSKIVIKEAKNIETSALYNCSKLDYMELDRASVLGAFSFKKDAVIKTLSIKNVTLGSIKETIDGECDIIIDTLELENAPVRTATYFDSVKQLLNLNVKKASLLNAGTLKALNLESLYLSSPNKKPAELLGTGKKLKSLVIEGADITSDYFDGVEIENLTLKNIGTISKNAFNGCHLDTLVLDNVSCIEPFAFVGSRIEDIKTINSNKYQAEDGFLYKNNSIVYCYDKAVESVELTDNIKLVYSGAFDSIDSLTSLIITGENTYIADEAFYNCNYIRSLELGSVLNRQIKNAFTNANSIKYVKYSGQTIKRKLFASMKGLREVVLMGTKKIGDLAFSGCELLENITGLNNLTHLGDMAFYNCRSLKSIKLESECEYVGACTFEGCVSLREIIFPITKQHIKYQMRAKNLFGITRTNEMKASVYANIIPAYFFNEFEGKIVVLGNPQEVQEGAFMNASVEAISLKNIKVVEKKAFYGSTIKLANMPSVSVISEYAFASCNQLESITINEFVEKIDSTWVYDSLNIAKLDGAKNGINYTTIANCLVLNSNKEVIYCAPKNDAKSISFGNLVKRVGKNVFANSIVSDLDLSDAEYIEKDALRSCKSLSALSLATLKDNEGKNQPLSYFVNEDRLTKISLKSATLTEGAFDGFKSLKSIEIESPLKKIPAKCFRGCNRLEKTPSLDEVSTFGKESFEDCVSLRRLTLPYLGKNIDTPMPISYLFGETVPNIVNVEVKGGMLTAGAFKGCQALESITLGESINKIPDECFNGCYSLKSIIGAEAIDEIGENAFSYCRSLTSVKFTRLRYLGKRAFAGCSGLVKAELDSMMLDTIGAEVFKGTKLEELTIKLNKEVGTIADLGISTPNNHLKRVNIFGAIIYDNAFENCTGLKTVTSDKKITTIGNFAFAGCDVFVGGDILKTATKIGSRAFYKCLSLKNIELKSIKQMEKEAFMGCTALKSVALSDELEKIPEKAFAGCTSLEKINIPASLEVLGTRAFMETSMKNCELRMPKCLNKVGEFIFENAHSPIVLIKPKEDKGWDINWNKGCKRHGLFSTKVKTKKY